MGNVYSKYYEKNKGYQMELYAYSPPGNGVFNFDGHEYFCGQDFRTVEHYTTYKNCGLNTILGQVSAKIDSDDFEHSDAKIVMDIAQQIGIKKFILLDDRLRGLSATKGGVIGEDKEFKSEAELDKYVENCIKGYEHHPMFSALQLVDEPVHETMKAVGQVYKSIKRVRPNVDVQCNLNPPMIIFRSRFLGAYKTGGPWEKYKQYLYDFLDETGADYFLYDYYPLINEVNSGVHQCYVRGMQIAAEVAQERGVDFRMVLQTMFYRMNGRDNPRYITKEDMFFQVNMVLGYGIKQIAYFTYISKATNLIGGEYFPADSAIVTRMCEPTPLYYGVKAVNGHIQQLAPLLKDFEYVADSFNMQFPCMSRPAYSIPLVCKTLKNVKEFTCDKELALVNEMYNKENDQYLYRIMNGSDPVYAKDEGIQTVNVCFDGKFRYADVFKDGEWKTIELVDGKYETKLNIGEADYLLIY